VKIGKKERMKEPDIEGLATHDGPESCAGVRKGEGEALTGVHTGRPLSREINSSGVPTPFFEAEGNTGGAAIARHRPTRRGRRSLARVEPSCTGHGRSPGCLPRMARRAAPGRPKAERR
jgi:hypothetical protein